MCIAVRVRSNLKGHFGSEASRSEVEFSRSGRQGREEHKLSVGHCECRQWLGGFVGVVFVVLEVRKVNNLSII